MSEFTLREAVRDRIVYHCDERKYDFRLGKACVEPLIDDIVEAISAWNRRAQPENARAHARETGICPMCEDCPDGCPVETPNDSRNRPENEPLTLDEMNALDHEPIYVLHTGGKWTMNGWHIATASSYQNHGRCDLEIDNGNTIIDMQNYGKTWLAYRTKPERSEGE